MKDAYERVKYVSIGSEDNSLRTIQYGNTRAFLLFFSVLSRESYKNITTLWYPEILSIRPKTPIILVGTHAELRNDEELLRAIRCTPITKEEGEVLAAAIKAAKYLECYCDSAQSIKEVYEAAVLVLKQLQDSKSKKCSIS
eukprot:TRINITY_DN1806_c0_g1_i2.p1 TRINITY_DN1806_c0_g1~~TRINITY_DN1806_c0_g1_i2.p1  ORF type:complete len:141 (-),score=18.77 TRINITY_DN1806_c0_g1_i2:357-779(-)